MCFLGGRDQILKYSYTTNIDSYKVFFEQLHSCKLPHPAAIFNFLLVCTLDQECRWTFRCWEKSRFFCLMQSAVLWQRKGKEHPILASAHKTIIVINTEAVWGHARVHVCISDWALVSADVCCHSPRTFPSGLICIVCVGGPDAAPQLCVGMLARVAARSRSSLAGLPPQRMRRPAVQYNFTTHNFLAKT
jgi:hypothetical protein